MPNEINTVLARWQLDPCQLRDEMYRAPTPRERERWHALWLLSQGWAAAAVARAFERDSHTIGGWLEDFRQRGPAGLVFVHTGGAPPSSTRLARPR